MSKKAIIGLLAGLICGFFGAGGGLILVPAYVYFFCLNEKEARATSTFSIIPMVLLSGLFYYESNFFNWILGLKVAIGGIVGGIIGSLMLKKLSSSFLKISFAFFLIYMGIKMII